MGMSPPSPQAPTGPVGLTFSTPTAAAAAAAHPAPPTAPQMTRQHLLYSGDYMDKHISDSAARAGGTSILSHPFQEALLSNVAPGQYHSQFNSRVSPHMFKEVGMALGRTPSTAVISAVLNRRLRRLRVRVSLLYSFRQS